MNRLHPGLKRLLARASAGAGRERIDAPEGFARSTVIRWQAGSPTAGRLKLSLWQALAIPATALSSAIILVMVALLWTQTPYQPVSSGLSSAAGFVVSNLAP